MSTARSLVGAALVPLAAAGAFEARAETVMSVTQVSYDSEERVQCAATRMNPAIYANLPASACTLGTAGTQGSDRITENVYDPAGQLIQVRRAVGTSLEQAYATYTYTLDGKQEYVIDANGNRAKLTYDGFDRQVGWYFPSPTKPSAFNGATQATALATAGAASTTDYESYGYDADGNRTGLKKRDGQTIAYSYDGLNRMTLKDVPGTTADVYYGYDLDGHQLYARFASASGTGITNTYDALGRLASASNNMDGTARQLSYQYDLAGDRTRMTYPDTNYWSYIYDAAGRPTAIKENGATQVASFAYDAQGRRSGDTRGAIAQAYGHDSISRLTSLGHDLVGAADDVSWTLGYNPANQIISSARSNDLYAYAYAAMNKSYAVNGLNQYTTAAGATLAYDANGNITSDGTTTYGYDVENRLITASSGVTLDYDPTGRLWRVTTGPTTNPTTLTTFVYDGDALIEERNGAGALLRRYIHGNDEDDPMLWYEGAGLTDRRGMTVDHQGSITAIADSTGAPIRIDSYDEYGVPGASNIGRFQYTGQAWLPELGIYYYKARMYSSRLGRFLQTDPVGYKDQMNLYAYAGNDPIDGSDPSGDRTIYVGGGCDGYCTSQTTIVKTYAAQHGGVFFRHFQTAAIINEMKDAKSKGEPIILIGHSWGASAVMQIVADKRNPRPDLLVTVDPVGKGADLERDDVGGLWVNITAKMDDPKLSTGNYVADLWGRTDPERSGRADDTVDSNRIHEDFSGMLNDARVPEMIKSIEGSNSTSTCQNSTNLGCTGN